MWSLNKNTCFTDIDECAENPCGDHGECVNLRNAFNCVCVKGYFGVNCENGELMHLLFVVYDFIGKGLILIYLT